MGQVHSAGLQNCHVIDSAENVTFNRLNAISTLEWILYCRIRKVPEVVVWQDTQPVSPNARVELKKNGYTNNFIPNPGASETLIIPFLIG